MPIGMSKNAWFNTSDSLTNIVKENLVLLLDAGNLSSYSGGTTWYDLSPNENDATLVGSPAFNPSRNGCFFLRGTSSTQYATIAHDPTSMDFSDQQTICMWLLPEGGSDRLRRNPYNQAFGGPGTLTMETNKTINYYFGTNGGNALPYVNRNSGFTLNEGELVFITVTRNQTTNQVKWYKNGALITNTNAGGYASTANGTNPILIGDGYVNGFLGNIYFCAVYNRALSADEVDQNYKALLGRYQETYTGWKNFGFGLQSESLNYYDIFDDVDYTSADGGSLVFNGSANSYIDFNANIGGATTVSVEMWVKPNLSSNGRMFFGWDGYDVYYSTNLGYNTANGDIYGISSATISSLGLNGNWKHYVFEMRSDVSYTNNKIYINGVSQTLSQQNGSENSANRNFNSGNGRISGWRFNSSNRMPMNLSVFRVYNRALSLEEVEQNFNALRGRYGI